MFRFDLATLDQRDVGDTLEACRLIYDCVAGQHDNPLFAYLRGIFSDEADRRKAGAPGGEVEIVLPVSEATGEHVLCFARLTLTAQKMCRPALAEFYEAVFAEIESSMSRAASAAMN